MTLDPARLEQTSTELLQQLIRFNTVNPPGDEAIAQAFIQGLLEESGFKVEVLSLDPKRPNLVATLEAPNKQDGPTLALLTHIDTVLANADEWQVDPWSGEIRDGCIWGRGAQDMKGQAAAEIAAATELVKAGWRPESGALKIIVTADEEAGGAYGARWLCEEHPEKVRCDYALNEGGGNQFVYNGRRYFRVGCAEKGPCRFTVSTHGAAGHASMPRLGDNALLKLAPLIEKLAGKQPLYDLTAEPRAILTALVGTDPGDNPSQAELEEMLAEIRAVDERLFALLEPTMGVSMSPTIVDASQKINVIPDRATVRVDCRVPPGHGAELAEQRAREMLGEGEYEITFAEAAIGNGSPHDTKLMDLIKGWLGKIDPDAIALPSVLPGFTDSRWFREAFPDVIAYGFFPQIEMEMYDSDPLMHAADERIPVQDLTLATEFFAEVVPALLG
ncbi:MAG: M20/M25/M40 family metallo-hydrolase [Solirubrobacterales bacterium]|nr:M20/M25/M40 family metallo-hydrolase [Solirubrobacterales bacterium]